MNRNRLDTWPRCRHSREGGNPVYFGLHGYKKSVWIPAFAGMTVAGSKRLPNKFRFWLVEFETT